MKRQIPTQGHAPRRSSMPPMDETPRLVCPIGLFEVCEPRFRALSAAINEAEGAEKVPFAQDLIAEADRLLACTEFKQSNENCVLCRNFSGLRRKTASLVAQIMTPGAKNNGGRA